MHQVGHRIGLARSRRVWSRVFLGLTLGGRFYFLTLTSSPDSPPIERSWASLLRWLRRHHPGIAHIHVITDEGHGVVHLVVRLRHDQANIDVRALREFWRRRHRATQIRIERVRSPKKLTSYLSEQAKKGVSSEMAYQVRILSWRYTRSWLPVGFTRAYGRFYFRYRDMATDTLARATEHWIRKCHEHPDEIDNPPRVET